MFPQTQTLHWHWVVRQLAWCCMIQIVAVPEVSHWLVSQVGHNAQAPSDMPSPPDPEDHSRAALILGRMANSNHEASPAPGGDAKQHLMQIVRESFVGGLMAPCFVSSHNVEAWGGTDLTRWA